MNYRISKMSILLAAFGTAICLACVSCSHTSGDLERRDAMRGIQRTVAVLHSFNEQWRNKPGFPASEYRTEGGVVTCSWRLTIEDVSEEGPYPDQWWKSPFNQAFDTDMNRRFYSVKNTNRPSEFTQLFALVGPGTAFTEYAIGNGRSSDDAEPDAILLLDCKNDSIHWMEPGDINVAVLKRTKIEGFGNLRPNYSQGFLIAFVDGAVWWIDKNVPHDVISPFVTLEGAQSHDRDKELAPYALDKLPPLKKHEGHYLLEPLESK